ncbi:hypothetical protein Ccrd_011520, partial [Cynara cardunculus var. scolymus]
MVNVKIQILCPRDIDLDFLPQKIKKTAAFFNKIGMTTSTQDDSEGHIIWVAFNESVPEINTRMKNTVENGLGVREVVRRNRVTGRDELSYEEMVLFRALADDLGVDLFKVSDSVENLKPNTAFPDLNIEHSIYQYADIVLGNGRLVCDRNCLLFKRMHVGSFVNKRNQQVNPRFQGLSVFSESSNHSKGESRLPVTGIARAWDLKKRFIAIKLALKVKENWRNEEKPFDKPQGFQHSKTEKIGPGSKHVVKLRISHNIFGWHRYVRPGCKPTSLDQSPRLRLPKALTENPSSAPIFLRDHLPYLQRRFRVQIPGAMLHKNP